MYFDVVLHVAWLIRYGDPTSHGYLVSIHKDIITCEAVAEHAASERGGKYLPLRVPCHLDMGTGNRYPLDKIEYPKEVWFVAVTKYIKTCHKEVCHPVGVFTTKKKAAYYAEKMYPGWKIETHKVSVK